jgi:signal transduction histidine kinase
MKKILAMIASIVNFIIDAGAHPSGLVDTSCTSCRGVNLLCLYITVFVLIGTPVFYYITGDTSIIRWGLGGVILLLAVIVLHLFKRYYAAKVVFYLGMNVMTLGFSAFLNRPEEAQLMYFFLLSLIFLVFDETIIRIICLCVIVVRIFLLELNFKDLILRSVAPHDADIVVVHWTLLSFILSLIILTFYLYISRLINVEKVSEKRNIFAQHMSHDVQVAYFSVAGISAHLKEAIDSKRTLMNEPALVNALMDASTYFSYILNNFLDYTKSDNTSPELVHFEEMDLGAEIEKIVDLHLYIAHEKGIDMKVMVGDELPGIIMSDRTKVIRIFLNLLSNAIKNTPNGKSIVITLDAERHLWKLSVINEGEGLRQEEVNTLFIPYRLRDNSARERKISFGLGITKDLVDALGGHIDVISELNKKTSFTVSIPLL